ncbi:MAG: UbiA family prenyltransferase [Acidimicrobiia bacterium]
MKRHLATINALVRPPFAVLLGLFAAVGMAQAGAFPSLLRQLLALGAISGWMLWAVALNDVADEDVDRVNLVADLRRVLVHRTASRRELVGIAAISATVALACAAAISLPVAGVVGGGLLLAAAYSLPPFRLSGRGALTAALLPLGYVTVPFLVGAWSVRTGLDAHGAALLAALYLGFMGRLVLKDFRDVVGDRLYGKRTLLVRHGRRRTCAFSASFWAAGWLLAIVVERQSPVLVTALSAFALGTLWLLRRIAGDEHGARDTVTISTIAVLGRAFLCTLVLDLSMALDHRGAWLRAAVLAVSTVAWLSTARDHHRRFAPSVDVLGDDELAAMPPPVTVHGADRAPVTAVA